MNAELFWKIIFIFSCCAFLIVFTQLPKTNCEACDFNGVSVEEFIEEYYQECIYIEDPFAGLYDGGDLQLNFTLNNSFK